MADFERLSWVLDLQIDDSSLKQRIRAIEAEFNALTTRASTQGENLTRGGPTATNLASETAELQSLANRLITQVQAAAGTSVTRTAANQLAAQFGENRIAAGVTEAVAARAPSQVGRFTSTVDAASAAQAVAQAEVTAALKRQATAVESATIRTTLSTAEVIRLSDPNVSREGIAAQTAYIEALKRGTGQFEGRGISQVGIQEPLQIQQSDLFPQGRLTGGEHRLVAAEQLGLTEVPVEIRDAEGKLIDAVTFRANAERIAAEKTAKTADFLASTGFGGNGKQPPTPPPVTGAASPEDPGDAGARNVAAARALAAEAEQALIRAKEEAARQAVASAEVTAAAQETARTARTAADQQRTRTADADAAQRAAQARQATAQSELVAAKGDQRSLTPGDDGALRAITNQRVLDAQAELDDAKRSAAILRADKAEQVAAQTRLSAVAAQAERDAKEVAVAQKALNDAALTARKEAQSEATQVRRDSDRLVIQVARDTKKAAADAADAEKERLKSTGEKPQGPFRAPLGPALPPQDILSTRFAQTPTSSPTGVVFGDTEALIEAIKRNVIALDAQRTALLEATLAERQLANSGQDVLAARAEYAASVRSNAAQTKAGAERLLASDEQYIQASAEAAAQRRVTQAEVTGRAQVGAGLGINQPALFEDEGQNKAVAKAQKAQVDATASAALNTEQNIPLLVEQKVQLNALNRAVKQQTAAAERAAFEGRVALGPNAPGGTGPGSITQRIQAFIAQRQSGDFKDPNNYLQLGQLLSSRLLTSASFAISGLGTIGAVQEIRAMITESENLERVLSQIHAQFNSLGDSQGFESFRAGIVQIARDTGTASDKVAQLAQSFRGALGQNAGGNLSDAGVLTQVKSAVEFAKVSGVDLTDISNNLLATAKTYGVAVAEVADATVALSQRTGVSSKEILDSLGQVAPVSDQVGLSLQKTAAILATAESFTGKSGNAIAQSFARILPTIQTNATALETFYRQADPQRATQIFDALVGGQSGQVFDLIGQGFSKLSQGQQTYVASLLGSKRDTQSLLPVLQNYALVLTNTDAAQNSAGTSADAYGKLQQTLSQQISRLSESFKQIGEAILHLGVSAALQEILKTITNLIQLGAGAIGFLSQFNTALGGIPGKILPILIELGALLKVLQLLQKEQVLNIITKILPIGGGSAAVAEGAAATGGGGFLAKLLGGGLLGKVLGGGGTAAAGASEGIAVGGAEATGAFGIAGGEALGLGALSTASLVTGGALVGLVALNRYMDTRSKVNKTLDTRLQTLTKLDANQLRDLISKETGSNTETITRFLTGAPTDKDIDLTALRIVETSTEIGPQLKNLVAVFDANGKAKAYLQGLQDKLDKSGGKNKKDFQAAQSALASFKGISEATGVSQELLTDVALQQGSGPNDASTSDIISGPNSLIDRAKQLVVLEAQLTTETGDRAKKDAETAKHLRATYFNNSTTSATDLFTGLQSFQSEIKSRGTIGGIPVEQFKFAGDLISATGTDLVNQLKSFNQLKDFGKQQDSFNAALSDLKTIQTQFKAGEVGHSAYQSALNNARDIAKQMLEQAIKTGQSQDILDKLDQSFTQVNDAANAEAKALADLRVANAIRPLQLVGTNPALIAKATAQQTLSQLGSAGLQPSDQIAYANQYVQNETQYLTYLASQADSQKAASEILAKGIKLPPQVRIAFNVAAILQAPAAITDTLQSIAKDLGVEYSTLINEIAAAQAAGKTGLDLVSAVLGISLSTLKAAQASGHRLGSGPDAAAIQALQSLKPDPAAAKDAAITAQDQVIQSYSDVNKALAAGDPVKIAQVALDTATQQIKAAQNNGNKDAERTAFAAYINAQNQLSDAFLARNKAALSVLSAQAHGDPVQLATIAIRQGELDLANAKGDPAKISAAQAEIITGQNQAQDAQKSITDARLAVLNALADGDPVKQAQNAIQQAQNAINNAHSEADRLNGLAQEINAQHQLRDALQSASDAHQNVLIAIANSHGDTVKAAAIDAALAKTQYDRAASEHGADSAQAQGAQQNLITKQATAREALISKAENDIQFELDLKKISAGQAIARLQSLLAAAAGNEIDTQRIQREIFTLQTQLGQDLQFNLPKDLRLPTLYEARRLDQSGGSYQDNRTISVTVNGSTHTNPQQTADAVAAAISAPPRFGTRARTY